MSALICPVCSCPLAFRENSSYSRAYVCEKGHSFDISSKGYVNFMTGAGASGSGDNDEMARSRHEFLEGGAYARLADFMAAELCGFRNGLSDSVFAFSFSFADAGCGDGYYTGRMVEALSKIGETDAYGFDLSKRAVMLAAKRQGALFAVAGVFKMPIASDSLNAVTSIFAPVADAEAHRTLKPGGRLYVVSPGERHLYELKRIIYDEPYENILKAPEREGFERIEEKRLSFPAHLNSNSEIKALFNMTPYAYKTSERDVGKLENVNELDVTAEFIINIYEKKPCRKLHY
ncbi:23S rRNA (guanine(745)-N(1))-methyltransferase [bioreactor metagenome]|uniref:23S rRNA (Guanine(745)-N(1))-methyltransferase n=1 Tax=bioreactor metagenome TaxID=1076179 RepID=A0A644Z9V8_9ZZZZ|nr:methyltransferase domain-containing protein [Oscillospiraceae bacterium]